MADEPLSYWMAAARMGFEEDFNRLFDELGISRTELAERLGTTPAYISKILNGRAGNFQLETMTKMARALGAVLQIRLIKEEGEVVRVVDYETARALDSRFSGAQSGDTLGASDSGTIAALPKPSPRPSPEPSHSPPPGEGAPAHFRSAASKQSPSSAVRGAGRRQIGE